MTRENFESYLGHHLWTRLPVRAEVPVPCQPPPHPLPHLLLGRRPHLPRRRLGRRRRGGGGGSGERLPQRLAHQVPDRGARRRLGVRGQPAPLGRLRGEVGVAEGAALGLGIPLALRVEKTENDSKPIEVLLQRLGAMGIETSCLYAIKLSLTN